MENYLSNNSKKLLNKVIDDIKNSKEYIKCISLKEEMSKDIKLTKLIEEVKILQKKYIRSNYDSKIKDELERLENELNNNKLFIEYNYYLDIVNKKIDIVKDELNNYFSDIVNYSFTE